MSRQRIRTSVLESSTEKCPVCGGSGHVRSVSSVALQLLRAIEEMLNKGATHNLIVRTRSEVALYVLNHKRAHLRALEERFRITITISADATVNAQVSYIIDRGEQVHTAEAAKLLAAAVQPPLTSGIEADEDVLDAAAEADMETEAEAEAEPGEAAEAPDLAQADTTGERPRGDGEREGGRRRRRRGRGRGRGGEPREPREGAPQFTHETMPEHAIAHEDHDAGSPEEVGLDEQQPRQGAPAEAEGGEVRRRRRRGRRGGRRNRQGRNGEAPLPSNGGEGEPGLQHAVEDLDRPPASFDRAPAYERPAMERPIIDRPYNEPPATPPEARPAPPPAAAPAQAAAAAPALDHPRTGADRRDGRPAGASDDPAAADAGDLQHGERGQRPAQARLVGQALLGRQELTWACA